jgi:ribosome-associated protein
LSSTSPQAFPIAQAPKLTDDTRNPVVKHQNVHDYCEAKGIRIERTKLFVGDYTLPTNQSVCVDTKKDLEEVSINLSEGDKSRFMQEILRAQSTGIRLVFLVEQSNITSLYDVANWDNPNLQRWITLNAAHKKGKMLYLKINEEPPKSGPWIAQKMNRMSRIHNVEWQFCNKSDTGQRIIELLMEEK